MKVMAKPVIAPHSIMPSMPRFSTPLFLDHQFAGRGEQDRRRDVDDRDEGENELIEGHARLATGLAAPPQSNRMRRRTSTSLAKMKNSIIP